MSAIRPIDRGPALAGLVLLGLAAAAPSPAAAADTATPARPRSETIFLRVAVGPDGHVLSTTPFDDKSAMLGVARSYASKLVFTPATRDGHAAGAETCLTVRMVATPRPDGTFAVGLKRAISGPCVVSVGKTEPPRVPRDAGGLVVMGAVLRTDGSVDPASVVVESAQLRVPSSFVEARYRDAAEKSLRATRFEADKVDGKPVSEHVSVPYQFGRGPARPERKDEGRRGAPPPEVPLPSWNAKSLEPNVTLASIDFTAP
jgi:hypothetical protein